MSLESILSHILDEAKAENKKIIQQARQEKDKIIQQAQQEADKLYHEILRQEESRYRQEKQRLIVSARLESKKNLLKAKQELIDKVFAKLKSHLHKDKFKKQQIFSNKTEETHEDIDFYLNQIRPDYETEVAKILFE